MKQHRQKLSENIVRSLEQDSVIRIMHGLGKFHKGKIFLRPHVPVVAIVGSKLHGIGRWVSTYFKEFLSY